jgi:hypothetical protein
MADFNSKSDADQDHRRRLLSAARNGQSTAKAELEKEYHVKVYSEAERSVLHYEAIPQAGRHASRRHLSERTQIDDIAISDETDLPLDRSL